MDFEDFYTQASDPNHRHLGDEDTVAYTNPRSHCWTKSHCEVFIVGFSSMAADAGQPGSDL